MCVRLRTVKDERSSVVVYIEESLIIRPVNSVLTTTTTMAAALHTPPPYCTCHPLSLLSSCPTSCISFSSFSFSSPLFFAYTSRLIATSVFCKRPIYPFTNWSYHIYGRRIRTLHYKEYPSAADHLRMCILYPLVSDLHSSLFQNILQWNIYIVKCVCMCVCVRVWYM